ncbi:MAG: aminotransferase class V-fold PLP-dependent enzyme [Myxococcota bacterium]
MTLPFTLDPDVHHLNHGSFGAVTERVQAAQRALQLRMERDPMRFFTQEVLEGLNRAREALSRFVGAQPDDLVFIHNATEGVATVLGSLALEPQDEILVNDHEYGACIKACEKTAATVRKVSLPLPTTAGEIVERLKSAIGARTRLALISHITSPTGLVFPLTQILEVFERRGVPVLVDGAHAPGMVPLDLQAWGQRGLRYYAANLHKWACAPKGTAFLWIREDEQSRIHPLVTSHGHNSVWPHRTPFTTRFDWTGTDDPSPFLVVPDVLEALALLHPGGWAGVRSANRSLALEARSLLLDVLGGAPLAPADMIGSLAAVQLPEDPGAPRPHALALSALQAELDAQGFRAPVMDWPAPPNRLLRVSAHVYNTIEEYRSLAQVVAAALRREATPS